MTGMKKTVSQKMGIKNGMRAILIEAPVEAIDSMDLPEIEIGRELNGMFDYIHLFVKEQAGLRRDFPTLKSHLKPSGMLWISWPKAGQLGTDLNIRNIIGIGYGFGLVESTCLSIDAVWSGLKFTHPKEGKVYQNSYGKLSQ
jgi:hypothetical protein